MNWWGLAVVLYVLGWIVSTSVLFYRDRGRYSTNTKTFLAMAMFPWWWWVSVEMARVWWRSRHA